MADTFLRIDHRVCLVGVLALGNACNWFAASIRGGFAHCIKPLAAALTRSGRHASDAVAIVDNIQGAVMLSGVFDNPGVLSRALAKLRRQTAHP